MVKLIPDSDAVQEILTAVNNVVKWHKEFKVQAVGMHPAGVIGWYQGYSGIREYKAVPLAIYTRTRNGITAEYSEVVAQDPKLFAQFEEAMRVALLNSSSA
jgi:hypothetical protein